MSSGETDQPFAAAPASQQLQRVASSFAAVAEAIESDRPPQQVQDLLSQARRMCAWASTPAAPANSQAKTLLRNLTTAVETWDTVWSRMGARREFRQAVVREAGLWSKKLLQLARSHHG